MRNKMTKLTVFSMAAVVGASVLTGCGGGSTKGMMERKPNRMTGIR